MRTLPLVGALIILLLTAVPIQARWESAGDNKSSTELAAMTNEQLFDEAFDVCVRRALLESLPSADQARAALAECNDYLDTIYPFVRERNGGNVPAWMSALVTAHSTKECQAAFRAFLSKSEKPAVENEGEADAGQGDAAEAARSQHPKKPSNATPPPPRSHWTEQLPPWIAPQ